MSTDPDQVRRYGWQLDAACNGEELALFFGPEGERHVDRVRREKVAIQICQICPVRRECLESSFEESSAQYGVRGGLGAEDRQEHRRKWLRSQQRGRKGAAA